jgi:hypothetical protein
MHKLKLVKKENSYLWWFILMVITTILYIPALNIKFWWVDDASRIKTPFLILKAIDDLIFRMFPSLRKYCWNTVLVYKK